jgi:hypothetical protein
VPLTAPKKRIAAPSSFMEQRVKLTDVETNPNIESKQTLANPFTGQEEGGPQSKDID